jgi:transcriptional regulator with XRE-family HTH domain
MTEEAKKDKEINMAFSEILIMERKKRSWSQKKLAEKLDVDASTVKRWEGGSTLPKNYAREKLQEVLHLSLMDLGLDKDFDDQLPSTRNNGEGAPEEGIPSEGEVGSQPAATDHLDSVERLDTQLLQETINSSGARMPIFAWTKQKSTVQYMALIVSLLIIFLPLIILLGYRPPASLRSNTPPTFTEYRQEENSIILAWSIKGGYDKYNILEFKEALGKSREQTGIQDQRSGFVRIEDVAPEVTYHFLVEGCMEARFFALVLFSTCTLFSPEVILITIRPAIEQEYERLNADSQQQAGKNWGEPIAPETYEGNGWYRQDFNNTASICWHEKTGIIIVYGSIANEWRSQGGGEGQLGYPIKGKEEHPWSGHPDGRIACFEHGTITWTPDEGQQATSHLYAPCI